MREKNTQITDIATATEGNTTALWYCSILRSCRMFSIEKSTTERSSDPDRSRLAHSRERGNASRPQDLGVKV